MNFEGGSNRLTLIKCTKYLGFGTNGAVQFYFFNVDQNAGHMLKQTDKSCHIYRFILNIIWRILSCAVPFSPPSLATEVKEVRTEVKEVAAILLYLCEKPPSPLWLKNSCNIIAAKSWALVVRKSFLP